MAVIRDGEVAVGPWELFSCAVPGLGQVLALVRHHVPLGYLQFVAEFDGTLTWGSLRVVDTRGAQA